MTLVHPELGNYTLFQASQNHQDIIDGAEETLQCVLVPTIRSWPLQMALQKQMPT